jgi:hypothetical protein
VARVLGVAELGEVLTALRRKREPVLE